MDQYISTLFDGFKRRNKQREFELSSPTVLASPHNINDGPNKLLVSSGFDSADSIRSTTNTSPRAESTIRGGSETNERRFNVHKRSLPPGLDQIVASNISKEEFDKFSIAFGRPFKTKEVENGAIYYDLVPVDATDKEKSPYYNPPNFMIGNIE